MPVQTVQEIGQLLRDERKARGMTQADFAMMLGVGRRFLIDLERGKETVEAGKMLSALAQAGFVLRLGKE
ncbi:MAG: helix-turn-helix transcriptional regulator [Alphaproteobacteria bacterium]|nr:helix-turn-helix transcriptional regulator [Alphaproteobacteria bacterium]